jgi:DNA-binding CsgD family transcriptional regulator
MMASEPFHVTRRAHERTSDGIIIETAPLDLSVPGHWFVEKLELTSLLVGNRFSERSGPGYVFTNWPLRLLQRSITERWYENGSIAPIVSAQLGWIRPGDWLEMAKTNAELDRRLRIRADFGLSAPHALSFVVDGVTGFTTVTRALALKPVEEKVVEFMGPSLFKIFLEHVRGTVNAGITRRERQCLGLTARGMTAGEIAESLGLSEHTVNAHMRNVSAKLGTTNRAHAIAEAMRLGLIRYGDTD